MLPCTHCMLSEGLKWFLEEGALKLKLQLNLLEKFRIYTGGSHFKRTYDTFLLMKQLSNCFEKSYLYQF